MWQTPVRKKACAKATGQCNESEILCEGDYYNFFPWDYSCASRREGCPVSCASGEHVCTTPAMCENCAAVQYCSTQPCPTDPWILKKIQQTPTLSPQTWKQKK